MLAGLIFAVQEADDRPGTLAATLPFAGMTVVEYQARLLIATGAAQIVVVVARVTPELLGAVARIGRRGVTVDTVRSAAEAAARLHPLSHLLVLADGLVTTDAILHPIAREGGDVLLVAAEDEADAAYELIGGGDAWAGIARLDGRHLGDVAAMPRDYDVQSALLHVAAQSGALRLQMPDDERGAGHGIERRRDTLETRSRAVVSAAVASRSGWFQRWIVRPIAKLCLPALMRRHVPTAAMAAGAAIVSLGGLATLWAGQAAAGLLLALLGVIAATIASSFAWLRDEELLGRMTDALAFGVPAIAAMVLGRAIDAETGELTALIVALALVVAGALGLRAAAADRPMFWGDPSAYLLVLALGALIGWPMVGLTGAAIYATVTLALAIETLRARLAAP
ncbi:hypothetical protein [Sphingomonas sp.]|jgi:hypothetical protein|uniref:hypothetical protein n=1 Tax=Sphingomonas sp. TaxID=28214 RepID=UPI00261BF770|nr:hypothetical protein [Sphingomonas sp.]MDF2604582.1 hypothetical protein [Sphingomonas sp.]